MVKRRLMGLGRQIQQEEGWVVMWDRRAQHLRITAVRRESGISCFDHAQETTLTSSFAFLNATSISSSGFQTRGRPASSYLNRSSNVVLSVLTTVASEVCSSSFLLMDNQSRARSVEIFCSFSSSLQLYAAYQSRPRGGLTLCFGQIRLLCLSEDVTISGEDLVPHI
jgi:hypothetical protein